MTTDTATRRTFNFSAGPAALPLPVLEQAQQELLCLPGAGASILEISHRSAAFQAILDEATQRLTRLLAIPDNYRVIFLQGGSRLQFSMVPMNLLRGSQVAAEYLVSGSWGQKAAVEAQREGAVRVIWDGKSTNYDRLPSASDYEVNQDAPYLHLTSNETIQGVQFDDGPDGSPEAAVPRAGAVPLVCDCSSDFLSRPVDVARYGLIYACAQKNAGPAGLTVVIVREDLLDRGSPDLPGYLSYREHVAAASLYNTPPTFAIYVFNLVAAWLENEIGGLEHMHEVNRAKAERLYTAIDDSDGFYRGHAQPECRSLMNVTFRLPSDELQDRFVKEAAGHDLDSLKGHRSVGGIRASIYNAMPLAGVETLRQFMLEFQTQHAD